MIRATALAVSISVAAAPGAAAQVAWGAPPACLPRELRAAVVAAGNIAPVRVTSTVRLPGRNARAGGAKRSFHLTCRAVDFRPARKTREIAALMARSAGVGGVKIKRGIIHIDNGPRRAWK